MYEYEETAEENKHQEAEPQQEAMRLFIRQAAQATEGRKFFRSLLDISECLYQAPETIGDALFLARHEGRRDVGIWLIGQLAEADELADVLKMEK